MLFDTTFNTLIILKVPVLKILVNKYYYYYYYYYYYCTRKLGNNPKRSYDQLQPKTPTFVDARKNSNYNLDHQ